MASYRLTQQVDAQLLDILSYSLETLGPRQADRYYAKLFECFQMLADNPRMGQPARRVGEGRRRHMHKQHVIIYVPDEPDILIIAVFHMGTDWRLPDPGDS